MKFKYLLVLLLIVSCLPKPAADYSNPNANKIPEGFVDIEQAIPGVLLDMRYYGSHNFLGERVDGYLAPKCYLTQKAAGALAGVQNDLQPYSMTLKIYDCYRPQRAVDHFVRWATQMDNIKTRKEFYPTVDKRNLFKD